MQEQYLLKEIEATAVDMTRRAGEVLSRYFGTQTLVEYKGKGRTNPVTEADKASQQLLKEAIASRFPGHGIVAEEDKDAGASPAPDYLWVVDPLDGTVNFLNGLPIYAVSVGVLHRGEPVVGCLFLPWPKGDGGLVLHARKGGGAFAGGEVAHMPETSELQGGRLAGLPNGFGAWHRFGKGMRGKVGDVRISGSIAYELALTAQGVFQYTIHTSPRIWDVAGGVLIVMEAGGRVMVRPRKSKRWETFHSFFPSWRGGETSLKEVRGWSAALLSGSPGQVEQVASNLKRRRRLGYRIGRMLRRLRKRPDSDRGAQTQGQGTLM